MLFRLSTTLLLTLSVAYGITAKQCYTIAPENLFVDPKIHHPHILLITDRSIDQSSEATLLLLDESQGRIEALNTLFCSKDGASIVCSGECDSGQLSINSSNTLTKLNVSLTKQKRAGEKILDEFDRGAISYKDPNQTTSLLSSSCPSITHTLFDPMRDQYAFEKKNPPKRYVCYNEKRKNAKGQPLYYDCSLNETLCIYNQQAYFGHYPNEKRAKEALQRCKASTPRPK
jgi:hypothetical protein